MNLGAASAAERGELLPSRGSFSGGGGGSSAPLAPPGGAAASRGHSCLLQVCRVFNFLTALCALLCALAFGMAIVVRGEATSKVGGAGWTRGGWGGPALAFCWQHARSCGAGRGRAQGARACGLLIGFAPQQCAAARQLLRPLTNPVVPTGDAHSVSLASSLSPASNNLQDAYFVSGQAVRAFGIGIALLIVMVRHGWAWGAVAGGLHPRATVAHAGAWPSWQMTAAATGGLGRIGGRPQHSGSTHSCLPPLPQVETEWPRFLALVPLLDAWLGRGVLQVLRADRRGRCRASGQRSTAAQRVMRRGQERGTCGSAAPALPCPPGCSP